MGLGPFETDRRIVNHIDGNGLNNTKANLQVCDFMINNQSFNTRKNVGCVYRDMKRLTNCWCATIKMFGTRHRKRFPTEEEARAFIHNLVKDHVKPPRPEDRPSQAEPVQVSTLQEIRDLLQIINQKVSSLSQA
jgi:hypothetical protein